MSYNLSKLFAIKGVNMSSFRKKNSDKFELIKIGMELRSLSDDDILYIIDNKTSYFDAQRRLTTNRLRSCG